MALRSDREVVATDVSYFMNETADKGVIVVHSNSGSGSALDQSANVVKKPTFPISSFNLASGTVVGLLLNDVVNKDLTRTHLNHHKDEVQQGSKVTLLTRGWAVTDKVIGNPNQGTFAYVTSSGLLTGTEPVGGVGADIEDTKDLNRVGRFRSKKDSDGFIKIEVNLV